MLLYFDILRFYLISDHNLYEFFVYVSSDCLVALPCTHTLDIEQYLNIDISHLYELI